MQQLNIGGLLGLGQAAMGQQNAQTPYGGLVQQAPQTIGTAQAAPQQAMDPQSQYLQAMLRQMGQGSDAPKNGAAVGEDLLAQALMRYGMNNRQQQQQSQQLGQDWGNLQAQNQGFQNGLGLGQSPNIIPGF